MSQTALNLAALLVFLMTFSILLGPFLSIPAEIPAIAVFAILGLTTVDTLQFKGRGTELVVDWFAQLSPQHQARILHHEAGHFLIAHQLGIAVTDYSLSAWEVNRKGHPGQGGVILVMPPSEQGQLSSLDVDRYCTVWMAGIAAEQIVFGDSQGGDDDRTQMRRLLHNLGLNEQQKQRTAILAAKTLLQKQYPAYQALVAAMEKRASVQDCLQILEDLIPVKMELL